MIVRRVLAVAGLLVLAGLAAQAQEPSPAVGAARGVVRGVADANVVPSTFRAQLVVDNRFPPKVKVMPGMRVPDEDRDPRDRTGKLHCLVCEQGLAPTVAIFVREVPKGGDGLAKLLTKLDAKNPDPDKLRDGLLTRYQADKLGAFVMFLKLEGGTKAVTVKAADGGDEKVEVDLEYPHDEKRADKVAEVEKYFATVNSDKVPFGLAAEKSNALAAFAVGDAPLTIIIYNRLRMQQRWELKLDELTDEKVAEITAAIETMIRGKKP